MKKTGVLNHRLSDVIARMGHTNQLVIADAGLPVPPGVERIDLAVRAGLPSFIDVVEAVAAELEVERFAFAEELLDRNTPLVAQIEAIFPGAAVERIAHAELKRRCVSAIAVVRTGEQTPYANVILTSGVTF